MAFQITPAKRAYRMFRLSIRHRQDGRGTWFTRFIVYKKRHFRRINNSKKIPGTFMDFYLGDHAIGPHLMHDLITPYWNTFLVQPWERGTDGL